jgi:mRNA interferase MazF
MTHRELYWVDLPDRRGREQRGRRPAVIWQDTTALAGLPTVLVVPLTSRLDAVRFPGTLGIDPSPANGITVPSVALVFQLGACDVRRLGQKLGRLDAGDVVRVCDIARKLQKLA